MRLRLSRAQSTKKHFELFGVVCKNAGKQIQLLVKGYKNQRENASPLHIL
jgi:hypothetical protein